MVVNLWSSDVRGSNVVDSLYIFLDRPGARAITILFCILCLDIWFWASTFEALLSLGSLA